MYALYVVFKAIRQEDWMVVVNTDRDAHFDSQNFALKQDFDNAHVFYTIEELLEVKDHIVRVLNRRGIPGEEFDENMEHTKDCVRTIRTYLNMRERFTVEFDIKRFVPESMGRIAFAIRSDML